MRTYKVGDRVQLTKAIVRVRPKTTLTIAKSGDILHVAEFDTNTLMYLLKRNDGSFFWVSAIWADKYSILVEDQSIQTAPQPQAQPNFCYLWGTKDTREGFKGSSSYGYDDIWDD